MADMMEYYQQISELKKAVRERLVYSNFFSLFGGLTDKFRIQFTTNP